MNPTQESLPFDKVVRTAAACLVVFILWIGRDILIPATIAVLISFVISPIVKRLRRLGIPNAVATSGVTLLLGVIIVSLAMLMSSQMLDLTRKIPEYRENLVQRIRSIKTQAGSSLANLHTTVDTLQHEIQATTNPSARDTQPVQVQVVAQNDWLARGPDLILLTLGPLTKLGIIILLVFFITLSQEMLAQKGRRLAIQFGRHKANQAVDEAATAVGRYLRMQLLVNITYGALIAGAMTVIGLPNAGMWGILAAMLRYLPYIGPFVSILMPTIFSIAIFPDWNKPILFVAMLVFLEVILSSVVEPLLYGHSTGVSSLGVVASTLFWGWLWGTAGLLLAMPLTSCLVVIGRHLRSLQTLADLLGTETPEVTRILNPAAVSGSGLPTAGADI